MEAAFEMPIHVPKPTSVKAMLESSGGYKSIPSSYSYRDRDLFEANLTASEPQESLPTIDYALLTSPDPDQRSKAVQDLGKACQDWGFFMLVNHGVPESLMIALLNGCDEFFNLPLEEKQEFASRNIWNPIRFGTGVDAKMGEISLWRDFLKVVLAHPQFKFPNKPKGFSEVTIEYCKRIRELQLQLLKGISESLGLEKCYIEKAMNLESGCQIFAANLYPRCPQPELAMGIPAHSDPGLLTFLIQNGIGGLQIQHNGTWLNVNPIPNSILVNTADQLEILINGKYKSDLHRAVVNDRATRISIVVANGPSLETIVSPAPELVDREERLPAFKSIGYKEFVEDQQSNVLGKPPYLEQIRLQTA